MRNNFSKEKGLKEKILSLKIKGYSFRQIEKKLKCSKSTISYHCSKDQKKKTWKRLRKWRIKNSDGYEKQKQEEVEKRKVFT